MTLFSQWEGELRSTFGSARVLAHVGAPYLFTKDFPTQGTSAR